MLKFGFATGSLATVIAQAVVKSDSAVLGLDWGEMIKAGGIVVICAFVLVRLEPRMRGMEAAIDRLTRMLCLFLGQLPHVFEFVKSQCKDTCADLDRAALERGDKPQS